MTDKNLVLILAGGVGNRFGASSPKPFVPILGKTVLEWTLDKFQNMSFIDEIYIVLHKDYINRISDIISNYPKVKHIVEGGECRGKSILNGISSIPDNDNNIHVIVHDAARPLISEQVVLECIHQLLEYDFVQVVAEPTSDIMLNGEFYHREKVALCSGPEVSKLNILKQAYNEKNLFNSVQKQVLQVTKNIGTVKTNPENIKITYPHDILYVEQVLSKKTIKGKFFKIEEQSKL